MKMNKIILNFLGVVLLAVFPVIVSISILHCFGQTLLTTFIVIALITAGGSSAKCKIDRDFKLK